MDATTAENLLAVMASFADDHEDNLIFDDLGYDADDLIDAIKDGEELPAVLDAPGEGNEVLWLDYNGNLVYHPVSDPSAFKTVSASEFDPADVDVP